MLPVAGVGRMPEPGALLPAGAAGRQDTAGTDTRPPLAGRGGHQELGGDPQ